MCCGFAVYPAKIGLSANPLGSREGVLPAYKKRKGAGATLLQNWPPEPAKYDLTVLFRRPSRKSQSADRPRSCYVMLAAVHGFNNLGSLLIFLQVLQ